MGQSLVRKLHLKPDQRAIVLNAPAGYLELLDPLPDGVDLGTAAKGKADFVMLFVRNAAELNRLGPRAIKVQKHDATFWIAYPKKSSSIASDITRDQGWKVIERAGFGGVASIAIDDTWTALRFRPANLVGKKRATS